MKILVTGATGLIGKALVPFLESRGHVIVRLRRGGAAPGEPTWDPERQVISAAALESLDGIIHLAGESVAGIWTAGKKQRIRNSRVEGTRLLCQTVAGLSRPPRWMICASAVGYYGSRGDELLREDSAPGKGFLADVCQEWEAAAAPVLARKIPVTHLRLGIVLDRAGGVLPRMLIPFRLGLGGRVGHGRQYMPWISLDDALGAVQHIMDRGVAGPVNFVAPDALTNAAFSEVLGRALRRPAVLPFPAFAARLLLGEMADELLLASAKAEPAVLTKTGYCFKHPDLSGALAHLLKEKRP
jgi:uncharacterized protein (TIGR01777 family)